MTIAPSDFAHWQAMRPTPPAAVWNRMVSPFITVNQLIADEMNRMLPLTIPARALNAAQTATSRRVN